MLLKDECHWLNSVPSLFVCLFVSCPRSQVRILCPQNRNRFCRKTGWLAPWWNGSHGAGSSPRRWGWSRDGSRWPCTTRTRDDKDQESRPATNWEPHFAGFTTRLGLKFHKRISSLQSRVEISGEREWRPPLYQPHNLPRSRDVRPDVDAHCARCPLCSPADGLGLVHA